VLVSDSLVDKLTIRRMRVADLADVLCIEQDVFGDPWVQEHFLKEIDNERVSSPLVARTEGDLIGYAVAWYVEDEVHLANIAVRRDYWRRRIGQALLDEAMRLGRLRGCKMITLEVRFSNAAAIQFYEKNGFKQIALREKYYADTGEDAVVMLRDL
jgi:ribosomal-protein-alanine N-acetyltransferase